MKTSLNNNKIFILLCCFFKDIKQKVQFFIKNYIKLTNKSINLF